MILKDTIILFDNTEDDKSVGKIKGSYDDVLIGYMTLIYQTAIKTKKNNKKTLYKYMKKSERNKK